MPCACHVCKRTGERTCDPDEAAMKCSICGRCAKDQEPVDPAERENNNE